MTDKLVQAALQARLSAHAPYSNFLVGCAVEGEGGQMAVGANMENGCYRLGVCAEQSALAAAQVAFGLGKVTRMVVAGGSRHAGSEAGSPVMPCGGCRQAIMEAAAISGHDIEIISCDHTGTIRASNTIASLLPFAFAFAKE